MKKLLLATSIALLGFAASADQKDVGKALKTAFPQIPDVVSVKDAPIPGLYEVVLRGEIVYVDSKVKYMIQGPIVRLSDRENITASKLDEVNRIDFDKLPLDKAIVHKNGNGERKLVVFADPNCGFCKRLDKETIPGITNATLYTLPLAILSADSETKSKQILCSPNPDEAWTGWTVKGITPSKGDPACEAKADETIKSVRELAKTYGIRGTPGIVFADGSRIPGFVTADKINQKLSEVHTK